MWQVAHDSVGLCWYRVGIRDSCLAPVADRSVKTLLAIVKVCILRSPSVRRVSYPSPQSSVNAGGTTSVSAVKDSHTKPSIVLSDLWCTNARTNMIKATWKHVKPYRENEVKCVLNSFKGSVSAGFDDVSELIVKRCG